LHQRPIVPTPDTFSYFIVFQSAHIKPQSVAVYLSGIVRELEDHFPDVRAVRSHPLVVRTLAGCLKCHTSPVQRKTPLCVDDLTFAYDRLHCSTTLNDQLFLAQLYVGFDALLRCDELTWPDLERHQCTRKLSMRHSLTLTAHVLQFTLPSHKADQCGDGNSILVKCTARRNDTVGIMERYITGRNAAFPYHPQLWPTASGNVPTWSWFMRRLHSLFMHAVSGHSMRAGGATAMANSGIIPHLIQ
ncbi:hypothetical protein PAXRUDRAFT_97007, partial [Paxillus rubicundulus Ve08.2h10]